MTTTFWLTAAVLIGLALAFIVYPLFFHRSGRQARTDQRNQNLLAYRSRMAELDAEYAAGILDEANYQQLKEELVGSLLDDVPDADQAELTATQPVERHTSSRVVALASLILVPVLAVLLYQHWGAMDDVERYLAMQEDSLDAGDRAARMTELVGQLRERLEANPDNPDGWAMLGRSYMRLERYPEAARAFERLAAQVEERQAQAVAWGLSAQAWFFDSRGAMTERVTTAINKALELNPDEVNALGLLGINAFSEEDYEGAIGYWQRIAEVAPDHPQLESIRQGIAEAYSRLGREVPESLSTQADDAVSARGVTVRVELSEAFAGQIPDDAVLFVFAREAGTRNTPPVAVARLRAADLPAEVRLDDRMAMAPTARISDTREVEVAARLSRSGNATPQAGDWQGALAAPLTVSAEPGSPAVLVIDQQLRD